MNHQGFTASAPGLTSGAQSSNVSAYDYYFHTTDTFSLPNEALTE